MIRMAQPAHPGRIVKTEIIEAHGLSVTEAARVLGSAARPCRPSLTGVYPFLL